ncbi:hypothetical protein H8S23_13715 [Anaerofilum sp. BX8]|uniref:Uncharacterized protein n=1 Tax=Anaerofilum hominis TaxID=2763016 RepID=A0A923L2B4_9FIRM|nr:hypothetical protein [Anaerofilum hominis]MBC5582565.1 hypothetical protein [Anaerofilum hominis]
MEAFIYATQLKTAYEDLEKAREKLAAAPEDKQYAAEEAYHYLRVQNLLDNPIEQLRQHNQESREERPGMVQAAGLALNLLGSTAESLAIPAAATAAGAGSAGPYIATGISAAETYLQAYKNAVSRGLSTAQAEEEARMAAAQGVILEQMIGMLGKELGLDKYEGLEEFLGAVVEKVEEWWERSEEER